eukprot:3376640-Prorocentrum_lima.AAC.1
MAGLQKQTDTKFAPMKDHQGGHKRPRSGGPDYVQETLAVGSSTPSLKPRTHTPHCSSRLR